MTAEILRIGEDLDLSPVGSAEIDRLTRLQRAAYAPWLPVLGLEPLPYRADYRQLLEDHEAWFVRRGDGTEVGALVIETLPDHLLIWSVAVAPECHGQGIGRALMGFAEAETVRRGRSEVRLYTHVLMAKNIALYQRLGYVETGREATPDGRRIVHMAKRLEPR
ncbi:GNAT family N-acetyltransferase [Aliidongia dinghuensis]|uniref:GNAT family N-acetyltransferase n=1 Tax=Aliidongia dinghuensis TaxID=1867774 RepID=A0A8J2YWE1_9PROT|nr:GNAT family N-acetyltransferase [Aliidongia dinghuensis]GGF31283.1 GNAT family N-acetyltransferase [Aliidongia dinghuensis]